MGNRSGCHRGRRRSGRGGSPACPDRRRLGHHVGNQPGPSVVRTRRPGSRSGLPPRRNRDERHRQAGRRNQGPVGLRGRLLPLLRRAGRQNPGRHSPNRQAGPSRFYHPRARRGGGRHRPVERRDAPHSDQGRPGSGSRQHRGDQGLRGGARPAAGVRRSGPRGGLPTRGDQPDHRLRGALWSGIDQPSSGQPGGVHRWCRNGPPGGREHCPELRPPLTGVGRQVPDSDLQRRRPRRSGERRGGWQLRGQRAELCGRFTGVCAGRNPRRVPRDADRAGRGHSHR